MARRRTGFSTVLWKFSVISTDRRLGYVIVRWGKRRKLNAG